AEADADPARRRAVVDAFLTAAREGDFAGLLAVLDPDVELRADRVAVAAAEANRDRGAPELAETLQGAEAVARVFSGRAQAAQPALLDGVPGAVYAPGGHVYSAFELVVIDGRIAVIEMIADPDVIAALDVEL
ncbi:MAG: hypothetical protein AVDCRST_MAG54-2161, partial [uncultured Actinomycetospora sp.]